MEIESALGLQHKKISMKERWQESPPKDAGQLSLNDYMITASIIRSLRLLYLILD